VRLEVSEVGRGKPLYRDQAAKDLLEARNGRLQYVLIQNIADQLRGDLNLTPDIVKSLHFAAVRDIYSCAGQYRTWRVKIAGSTHKPPEPRYVPGLVEEMCGEANRNKDWDPIMVSAFLLWRVNWIHPFGGGIGRTSRALAELTLRVRVGYRLPGKTTLPEQILEHRREHEHALYDADAAWAQGVLDVSEMTSLLARLLEERLAYLDELPGLQR
jgi:Fic family protein